MSKKRLIIIASITLCLITFNAAFSQEATSKTSVEVYSSRFGNEIRGKNAFTAGGGTAIINGDYMNPMWEIAFHAGYKRFLGDYFNIGFTYHKFNLAYEDLFNEGFMSFDLNIEAYLSPYRTFTPYIYVGGGLNAANYFEQSDAKMQVGGGIEYLFTESIGIKLFGDYNSVFSDNLDGKEFGESDDTYWRVGLGLNIYFGKRLTNNKMAKIPTVINSNQLVDDY